MDTTKKKSSSVAILLNALVLPGAGHAYLGYKLRGAILMIGTIFFIVAPLAKYAILISYALNIGTAHVQNPTLKMITAFQTVWPEAKGTFLLSVAALIIIWSYGIYDVYMKGRKQNQLYSPPLKGGDRGG